MTPCAVIKKAHRLGKSYIIGYIKKNWLFGNTSVVYVVVLASNKLNFSHTENNITNWPGSSSRASLSSMIHCCYVMHFWRDFLNLLYQLRRVYGWRALNPLLFGEVKAYLDFRRRLVTLPSVTPRPVVFPDDELPHGTTVEWWYLNARFKTSEGYPYAMHYVTFLLNTKDAHVSRRLKRVETVPSICFSLINLSRKTIRRNARCSRTYTTSDPPTLPLTIHTDDDRFTIGGSGLFAFKHEKLSIELTTPTAPMLVNDTGFVHFPTGPSFYVAYPRLDLKGTMRLYDRTLNVKGTAWLDHQWSNDAYKPYAWRWFSIQLQNGIDLVIADWGLRERQQFVTVRMPGGSQYTARQARCVANERTWKSPRTGFRYPLDWKIEVPELSLTLSCRAQFEDCEMTIGFLHYFEGPIEVSGTMQEQVVSGLGFMEQVQTPLSSV